MHNVVFVYTTAAGGYAGIRNWTSYTDKNEFIKMNPPSNDNNDSILAEGVTNDEAINLTSQTPEICHLTAAVEEFCYDEDGTVDFKLAEYGIDKAIMAIEIDRSTRKENGLSINQNIPDFQIGEEDTEKNDFLRFILESFPPHHGSLGILGFVKLTIEMYLPLVAIKRLSPNLPADLPIE